MGSNTFLFAVVLFITAFGYNLAVYDHYCKQLSQYPRAWWFLFSEAKRYSDYQFYDSVAEFENQRSWIVETGTYDLSYDSKMNPVKATLEHFYKKKDDPNMFYIIFTDQRDKDYPKQCQFLNIQVKKNPRKRGHIKGHISCYYDRCIYLDYSWTNWPFDDQEYDFSSEGFEYSQHMACYSFHLDEAHKFLRLLVQSKARIIDCKLPVDKHRYYFTFVNFLKKIVNRNDNSAVITPPLTPEDQHYEAIVNLDDETPSKSKKVQTAILRIFSRNELMQDPLDLGIRELPQLVAHRFRRSVLSLAWPNGRGEDISPTCARHPRVYQVTRYRNPFRPQNNQDLIVKATVNHGKFLLSKPPVINGVQDFDPNGFVGTSSSNHKASQNERGGAVFVLENVQNFHKLAYDMVVSIDVPKCNNRDPEPVILT